MHAETVMRCASVVQGIVVSDAQHDIRCDAHVQQLQPGQRLLVRSARAMEGAVFQVRAEAGRMHQLGPQPQHSTHSRHSNPQQPTQHTALMPAGATTGAHQLQPAP